MSPTTNPTAEPAKWKRILSFALLIVLGVPCVIIVPLAFDIVSIFIGGFVPIITSGDPFPDLLYLISGISLFSLPYIILGIAGYLHGQKKYTGSLILLGIEIILLTMIMISILNFNV
ncbi:MAG: hypothetical protein Q7S26_01315 [bacterium]|nr:hypothetical protein [bacterium]